MGRPSRHFLHSFYTFNFNIPSHILLVHLPRFIHLNVLPMFDKTSQCYPLNRNIVEYSLTLKDLQFSSDIKKLILDIHYRRPFVFYTCTFRPYPLITFKLIAVQAIKIPLSLDLLYSIVAKLDTLLFRTSNFSKCSILWKVSHGIHCDSYNFSKVQYILPIDAILLIIQYRIL